MLDRFQAALAVANFAVEKFTYGDGALPATLLTGQTWTKTGAPTIASNVGVFGANTKAVFSLGVNDYLVELKTISAATEGIITRQDSQGAYQVQSVGTNTVISYLDIVGSGAANATLATIAGAAANDVLRVVNHGNEFLVYRNGLIIFQALDVRANKTAQTIGIMGGTTGGSVDNFFAFPVTPFNV